MNEVRSEFHHNLTQRHYALYFLEHAQPSTFQPPVENCQTNSFEMSTKSIDSGGHRYLVPIADSCLDEMKSMRCERPILRNDKQDSCHNSPPPLYALPKSLSDICHGYGLRRQQPFAYPRNARRSAMNSSGIHHGRHVQPKVYKHIQGSEKCRGQGKRWMHCSATSVRQSLGRNLIAGTLAKGGCDD